MSDRRITHREITQARITWVLALGFLLVIAVLVVGGSMVLRNIATIERNAGRLVTDQRVTRHMIESLEDEQQTLSAVFYGLSGDPDAADAEKVGRRLDLVDGNLREMEKQAMPTPKQQVLWEELLQDSKAFGAEARRLLNDRAPGDDLNDDPNDPNNDASNDPNSGANGKSTVGSRDLFRRHEQVMFAMSQLVRQGFARVAEAEREIGRSSARFHRESWTLLGFSLALAVLCSLFTVRTTRELFRRMAWQEGELTRVSWQMLADQESIARRFSHELHDELGQTLAALKSNLVAIPETPLSAARLEDSRALVDESIRNVRSLSQLLRPMILDDFGLDAGLNWLCEGFMKRTGVEVDYKSNLHSRLPEQTETHLFRIAQEALTNVARHSGATKVTMTLNAEAGEIRLTIVDNGKGMPDLPSANQSLGMTGMRARARAVGGVFEATAPAGGGVRLEAVIPLGAGPDPMAEREAQPDPNPAG